MCIVSFFAANTGFSQALLLEKGVRADELWCYPVLGDSNSYKYLSSDAGLSYVNNKPEFSFLSYWFENRDLMPAGSKSSEAGSILHFLISYYTPEEKIKKALDALRKMKKNDKIHFLGPVMYTKAKYTLVSSILKDGTSQPDKVLYTGEAPVLENSKLAFSFSLDADKSSLLLESFKMATSDISFVFELSFSGLSENYSGTMDVNWSNSSAVKEVFGGGEFNYLNIISVGGKVESTMEELKKKQFIKVNITGSNADLQAQFNVAYNKLLDILFAEAKPSDITPDAAQKNLVNNTNNINLFSNVTNKNNTGGGDGQTQMAPKPMISLTGGYKLKKLKESGESHFEFNGRSSVSLNHFIAFNLKDIYQKYKNDQSIIKRVAINDMFYYKKKILVDVDSDLSKYIGSLVSNVNIWIYKKYQNGDSTVLTAPISVHQLDTIQKGMYFEYRNNGDKNVAAFDKYKYKYVVNLAGGGSYEVSDSSTQNSITIYCPFHLQTVAIEANQDTLRAKGVSNVLVLITSYKNKNKPDQKQLLYKVNGVNSESNTSCQIILPDNVFDYDYTITWTMTNGKKIKQKGTDNTGILLVNNVPKE